MLTTEFKMKGERVVYSGEGYRFRFTNDDAAYYTSVTRPGQLTILFNETGMKTKDLKVRIMEEWFDEENEVIIARKEFKKNKVK